MIRRLAVAVALVAVLAVGCGGDDSAGDDRAEDDAVADDAVADVGVITLDVVDDQLVGGVRREEVSLGEEITIVVVGDSTDRVHVHGYDRFIDLDQGQGELTFNALIPGIFEVELEDLGRLLIELAVS